MFIGVQYYRPPFPDKKYWLEDLDRIRDTGLDVIQLWACWGWIEHKPGVFKFDDYDELVKEAGKRGLKVVVSTIAEIQPFWIHRVVPDSHMIDHMGNRVISSLRGECNVGLTPGGCTDNPKVKEFMERFLQNIASRYGNSKEVIAWDCWNETRWNVQADGYVCYCPYTLEALRSWLKEKYKDLEGLNSAWQRRYSSWDDVYPGKLPGRPYTEMMEFLRFLTWRAGRHIRFRYNALRTGGAKQVISAHCASPSIMSTGWEYEQALCRGNDWELADQLDGFGCSHFPFWGEGFDEAGFGVRVEEIRSANRGKIMWVSELQGGSARDGHTVHPSVPAKPQQRWVWNGYARGAKGVIFWCWRDEVFGRESSGFGIIGYDGFSKERLKGISETSRVLDKYERFIDEYVPDPPRVGVLFEESNYYLDWASYGNADRASSSILGYLYALERLGIPYEVIDTKHLDVIDRLKFIILPWPFVIEKELAQKLTEFVEDGGLILTEAELDSFTPLGFYRYPGEDRTFAHPLGIEDIGRRVIEKEILPISIYGEMFNVKLSGWLTPFKVDGTPTATDGKGNVIGFFKNLGKGKVYVIGSFPGMAYYRERYPDFEKILYEIAKEADAIPPIRLTYSGEGYLQWRTGVSGGFRLLFIINSGDKRTIFIDLPEGYLNQAKEVLELRSESAIPVSYHNRYGRIQLTVDEGEWYILRWKI